MRKTAAVLSLLAVVAVGFAGCSDSSATGPEISAAIQPEAGGQGLQKVLGNYWLGTTANHVLVTVFPDGSVRGRMTTTGSGGINETPACAPSGTFPVTRTDIDLTGKFVMAVSNPDAGAREFGYTPIYYELVGGEWWLTQIYSQSPTNYCDPVVAGGAAFNFQGWAQPITRGSLDLSDF